MTAHNVQFGACLLHANDPKAFAEELFLDYAVTRRMSGNQYTRARASFGFANGAPQAAVNVALVSIGPDIISVFYLARPNHNRLLGWLRRVDKKDFLAASAHTCTDASASVAVVVDCLK